MQSVSTSILNVLHSHLRDQRLRQLMCQRETTNRCRLRWESGNTQMPLTSWWHDNFSHFGRWASIHRTPQFSSIRPRMPLECHKHQAVVGSRHHHYHRERHPVGRRSTGRGIILMLLSTTSAIVKVWRIYLVAQSAPKAILPSMFPTNSSAPTGPRALAHFYQRAGGVPLPPASLPPFTIITIKWTNKLLCRSCPGLVTKAKAELKAPLTPRAPPFYSQPPTRAASHPKD